METRDQGRHLMGRTPTEWFFGLPVVMLLIFTLVIGTGEMVHSQLLKIGETAFGIPERNIQYYMLRGDNPMPDCTVIQDVEAEVINQTAPASAGDDGGLGDLMGGLEPADPNTIRNSIVSANTLCQKQIDQYNAVAKIITPELKTFVTMETGFYKIFKNGIENRPLILLIMVALAAVITTRGVHHVVIRPPATRLDYRFAVGSVGLSAMFCGISFVSYYHVSSQSGIEVEHSYMYFIWMALFATLFAISTKQFIKPPKDLPAGGTVASALLAVPLFGFMGIVCGLYFFLHFNIPGPAIYINTLLELPSIFLSLALYIWAGMLLKQSRIVDLFMNVLRPWKLSPELLTYIILLAAALPTAYTGASGIFVIAAGGIVYNEVRAAGGSRQFALAATAMSGSLGVVLRPCLLVVLIAALNKQVTSNALYHWGFYVFLLTSTLFFFFSQLTRKKKASIERPLVAIPKMLKELTPVVPYALLVMAVVWAYKFFLDTELNESTAPVIMPSIMFFMLIFDKLRTPKGALSKPMADGHTDDRQEGVERSIRFATAEATGHIGALIMLMALSLAVGGLVERAEIMKLAPTEFSNAWTAMTFLMVTKVILGMFMDPFGAVILVSGTLAPIAYSNGIDPIHFWMMVLVAFELGYLMPPVALNQLLTRLVIGDKEVRIADDEVKRKKFYWRYERWILPTIVMTVGMLVTAYGPLAVQKYAFLKPVAELFSPAELDPNAPVDQSDAPVLEGGAATPMATDTPNTVSPSAEAQAPMPNVVTSSSEQALEPTVNFPSADGDMVKKALEDWAAAWSTRNVEAYLAHYASDFVSVDGDARPHWDGLRRQRIESKTNISVVLSDVQVVVQGNSASVKLTQDYAAAGFKERTLKQLQLRKEAGGQWLIIAEQSIKSK